MSLTLKQGRLLSACRHTLNVSGPVVGPGGRQHDYVRRYLNGFSMLSHFLYYEDAMEAIRHRDILQHNPGK